jgi:hypothetical protein
MFFLFGSARAQADSVAGVNPSAREVLTPILQFEQKFRAAELARLNGDAEKAKSAYASMLSSQVKSGPYLAMPAYRYAQLNLPDLKAALYWLDKALTYNDFQDTGLWLAVLDAQAEVYKQMDDPLKAALCYEQSLLLTPRSYSRQVDAVDAWYKAGQFARAETAWKQWGERFGQGPEWQFWATRFIVPQEQDRVESSQGDLVFVTQGSAEPQIQELATEIRHQPTAAGMEELAAWMYLNGEVEELFALATELEGLYPFSPLPGKVAALAQWAQAMQEAQISGWLLSNLNRLKPLAEQTLLAYGADSFESLKQNRPLYQFLLFDDWVYIAEQFITLGKPMENRNLQAEWKMARDLHLKLRWPIPARCQPYILE